MAAELLLIRKVKDRLSFNLFVCKFPFSYIMNALLRVYDRRAKWNYYFEFKTEIRKCKIRNPELFASLYKTVEMYAVFVGLLFCVKQNRSSFPAEFN